MSEHRMHITTWAHQKQTWYTVQCPPCKWKSKKFFDKKKADRAMEQHGKGPMMK